jgi:hypothetical protein
MPFLTKNCQIFFLFKFQLLKKSERCSIPCRLFIDIVTWHNGALFERVQMHDSSCHYLHWVIDGCGWALIGASNMRPVLVMRFEALDEGRLKENRELAEDRLSRRIEE